MKYEIDINYTYWACVSGGKDSFYMLYYILNNLDKYKLDGVIHYELEIDYPFIKSVIDFMEQECSKHNIPFVRIKPLHNWEYYYGLYGYPSRKNRWCNSNYKLSCKKQLDNYFANKNTKVIYYIGYCFDEYSRYNKRNTRFEIYPLVNARICENVILDWARTQSIYNDYYKYNKRCGCMFCPFSSLKELAYLLKYYPTYYNYFLEKIKITEFNLSQRYGKPVSVFQSNSKYNADYIDKIVKTKYLDILDYEENQLTFL